VSCCRSGRQMESILVVVGYKVCICVKVEVKLILCLNSAP
jgi:hypothetical protein